MLQSGFFAVFMVLVLDVAVMVIRIAHFQYITGRYNVHSAVAKAGFP